MIENINMNLGLRVKTRLANAMASFVDLNATPDLVASSGVSLIVPGAGGLLGFHVDSVAGADKIRDVLTDLLDVDWTKDTFWRVLYCSDEAAGAKSVTWNLEWKLLTLGTVVGGAKTALSTLIALDPIDAPLTADVLRATTWGILNKNSLLTGVGVNAFVEVDIKVSAATMTAAKTRVLVGYQLAYTPLLTAGKASDRTLAAPATA